MLVLAGLMAGGSLTWASGTTVSSHAALTIPALTRVSLAGTTTAGQEISVSVEVPSADGEGLAELKRAVVLVVRSNVSWTLVARLADRSSQGVEIRTGRGGYRPVRPEGLVLAKGTAGVHEVLLDYRLVLTGGTGWSGGRTLTLVYAVEG